MVELVRPRLADWLDAADINGRNKAILRAYLGGQTLQDCGDRYGLTRERVRQIVKKELGRAPVLRENRFRSLYEGYGLSEAMFSVVTGEPVATFRYLRVTGRRKPGRTATAAPLSQALTDSAVPRDVRELVRGHLDAGFVYVDGVRLRARRTTLLSHVVERHARDSLVTLAALRKLYDAFLAEHDLGSNEDLSLGSQHAFEVLLGRCHQVMKLPHVVEARYGGCIRYYDVADKDFGPLCRELERWASRDVECSCALLMADEGIARVLGGLDVHNEYELHYVVGNYCAPLEGVRMLRTPNIAFGSGNRNEQVVALIRELSPVSAHALSQAYEERYGVDALLVRGYYLRNACSYLQNGKYVYADVSLTDEQREFVAGQLASDGRDYYSLSVLKERFSVRFPQTSPTLLNAHNLEGLGFRPSHGLLVRDGVDEREMFARLLDRRTRFSVDDEEFGADVFGHVDFRLELGARVRSLDLVEYERGRYFATSLLRELDEPVCVDDLRDYVACAVDFMRLQRPYTVTRLRQLGFSHQLDRLREVADLGDYFYSSLIGTAFVGGKLKMTSVGGETIYCKTPSGYSLPRMLEQVMDGVDSADIDDLAYQLERDYGLRVDGLVLRMALRRSDLYVNNELDMVFRSREVYRRQVQQWIALG